MLDAEARWQARGGAVNDAHWEAPDRAALYERAARLVGTCRDRAGKRDVSAKHDRYLDEAFK